MGHAEQVLARDLSLGPLGGAADALLERFVLEGRDLVPAAADDEAPGVEDAAYRSFVSDVQDLVRAQGKELIGWEEVGEAPSAPYTVQAWVYEDEATAAVANGAELIASPAAHAYLDMKYDAETEPGTFWAGLVDVQEAYDWDPATYGEISPESVVGVEGCLWTETVDSVQDVELLTWPRLAGYAEIGWSPPGRDWQEYRQRLAVHGARLEALGLGFYRSPLVDWE